MVIKKIIGTFALLAIIFGGAAFASASSETKKSIAEKLFTKTYNGTVTALEDDSITIETASNRTYEFAINEDTEFVGEEDLAIDDEVMISGEGEKGGDLTAKTVKVKNKNQNRYGNDFENGNGHGNGNGNGNGNGKK
jgi:hypothetical protein